MFLFAKSDCVALTLENKLRNSTFIGSQTADDLEQ